MARPDEGEILREIAFRSKAHWGYEPDEVRRWVDRGDFSAGALRKKSVYVAEADGRAVAFASLLAGDGVAWLDDLWVEPEWIDKGVGTRLFRLVAEQARALGASVLEWEAEPNAVGFYERMGGRYLRDSGTSEWGRTLPIMGIEL
jgi:GNAT superfamily N-acetyltransferase